MYLSKQISAIFHSIQSELSETKINHFFINYQTIYIKIIHRIMDTFKLDNGIFHIISTILNPKVVHSSQQIFSQHLPKNFFSALI